MQPFLQRCAATAGDVRFHIAHTAAYYDREALLSSVSHIHDCHEIYVKIAGDVSFFHGSDLFALENCDVILSRPGDVHHCVYHAPCIHDHWCLWFSGDALGQYVEEHGLFGAIRLNAVGKRELLAALTALEGENDPFAQTWRLMQLLTVFQKHSEQAAPPTENYPNKLRHILQRIDEQFTTIDSVEQLARDCFLSVPTVNRLFRQHVKLSPHKLIEAKRLSFAEQLLRRGHSVTEACYQAGFKDCSRFIRKFKEKFGVTPYRYKQRHDG